MSTVLLCCLPGEGFGSVIPSESLAPDMDELTVAFGKNVGEQVVEYVEAMEKVRGKEE